MKPNALEPTKEQRTIVDYQQADYLEIWVQAFITARKAENAARGTVKFYQQKLGKFAGWCEAQAITSIAQLTPDALRTFLLWLEEGGHNPGGIHAVYRAVRAFLRWYELEAEPENWKNPIKRVKAPKVPRLQLEPASRADINSMVSMCQQGELIGQRDKAILLCLLDTGARAAELLSMDLEDLDITAGAILIRQGKGRKPRMVYLGKTTRRAIRAYLARRRDNSPAFWVTKAGERLTYWGLRSMATRRAARAGVSIPTLHSFRRLFALSMLRAGTDIFTLQKLMGHSDLQVLRRYLAQTDEDTRAAHQRAAPVDSER